ncbi:MAG: hypothetical protein SPE72_00960 [Alloprevotella sp.]|nr:hypothetical protein [Alloprevotella sp.]
MRRRYYNEVERRGTYTGWSRAWMIKFYARLHDGKAASENVRLTAGKPYEWKAE